MSFSSLLRKITVLAATAGLFLVFYSKALAVEYKTMLEVPGVTDGDPSFAEYVNILYVMAIVSAALLAVIQVVIGGAMYMMSEANVSSKSAAIAKIRSAIVGLLIVLLTWVILNTINSNLNVIYFLSNAEPIGLKGTDLSTLTTVGSVTLPIYSVSEYGTETIDNWSDLSEEQRDQIADGLGEGETLVIRYDGTADILGKQTNTDPVINDPSKFTDYDNNYSSDAERDSYADNYIQFVVNNEYTDITEAEILSETGLTDDGKVMFVVKNLEYGEITDSTYLAQQQGFCDSYNGSWESVDGGQANACVVPK